MLDHRHRFGEIRDVRGLGVPDADCPSEELAQQPPDALSVPIHSGLHEFIPVCGREPLIATRWRLLTGGRAERAVWSSATGRACRENLLQTSDSAWGAGVDSVAVID